MPVYNEKVMDHFMHPRNVGEIENPDGVGEEGNPVCGDMMTFYIKVKDNRLEDVKFKTFGCGAAIAVSSMVSELAKGMTLDEAMKLTPQSVAGELGGLPQNKLHCSNLGAQALHRAIDNYRSKQAKASGEKYNPLPASSESEHECPFCDSEMDESGLCQACTVHEKDAEAEKKEAGAEKK
jgi:nitrogen fixation protein NifU and related proteins